MLLMFSNVELHPSFLWSAVYHKSCPLSHNFLHNRKIYLIRKLLAKVRFKARFFTQTLVKWSCHNNVSHTKFATFYRTVWRATESHRINENSSFFFNFNFPSICPHQFFLLVLATILRQKFVIKKNLSKIPVLPFSFEWDHRK